MFIQMLMRMELMEGMQEEAAYIDGNLLEVFEPLAHIKNTSIKSECDEKEEPPTETNDVDEKEEPLPEFDDLDVD